MSLAVVTAIFFGFNTLLVKALTKKGWGESGLVWVNFTIGCIPLIIYAWDRASWQTTHVFWMALPFGVLGNMIAVTMLYRAIRLTKISIVLPLVAVSPIFMIFTSRFMVGQSVSTAGFGGILLVVLGAYLLGCSEDRSSILAPFAALWRDPGARSALLVAVLWSFTANIDKICIRASDELTYSAIFAAGMSLGCLPFFLRRSNRAAEVGLWRESIFLLIALGVTYAIQAGAHMTAIVTVPVPYVVAIKRGGVLIGVIHDIIRGERGIAWSAGGGILVLIGVIIIIFAA